MLLLLWSCWRGRWARAPRLSSFSERLRDERELRETIKPKLISQLQDYEMDDEDIKEFIEDLVDEKLGEEDQKE